MSPKTFRRSARPVLAAILALSMALGAPASAWADDDDDDRRGWRRHDGYHHHYKDYRHRDYRWRDHRWRDDRRYGRPVYKERYVDRRVYRDHDDDWAGAAVAGIVGLGLGLALAPSAQAAPPPVVFTPNGFGPQPYGGYNAPQRSGEFCREYQTDVGVGGRARPGYGIACLQPDGSWRIVQ